MLYEKERDFLLETMKEAFDRLAAKGAREVRQKAPHDLVTEVDVAMEKYISGAIHAAFPGDHIHGEELSSKQEITGRTWVIDPIDGTCNMARSIPMYGVQCALFAGKEPVLSAVYLPFYGKMLYAIKGHGCRCNGERVYIKTDTLLSNCIVTFGDYTRKSEYLAALHHRALGKIYPQVGKIRMVGAACLDFSLLAMGQTDGLVLITKNLWDLAPGILLCQEAGAVVTNLKGEPYHYGDDGVLVAATEEMSRVLADSFCTDVFVRLPKGKKKPLKGCLFDFDGVVVDTETYHFRSWNAGAQLAQIQLTWEEYLPLKSTGGGYISRTIAEKAGVALTEEELTQICKAKEASFTQLIQALSEQDILPGVEKFLQWLQERNIVTAMASSSNTSIPIARRFGLDGYFNAMFDGSTKMPRKPAPDVFLTAAKAIGAKPEDCVVFEDSLAGIAAAVNAGMDVIAVGGIRSDKALAHIADFREIFSLFDWE